MRGLLLLAIVCCAALGQSFKLQAAVVDGAGRRTAGSGYVLQFSLAQVLASDLLTGQGYLGRLGFWHRPYPAGAVEASPEPERAQLMLWVSPSLVRSHASVSYALPFEADVTLRVMNHLGERVDLLVSGRQEPGSYTVRWDLGRESAARLPNGVYFVQLAAGGRTLVRKLAVAR